MPLPNSFLISKIVRYVRILSRMKYHAGNLLIKQDRLTGDVRISFYIDILTCRFRLYFSIIVKKYEKSHVAAHLFMFSMENDLWQSSQ